MTLQQKMKAKLEKAGVPFKDIKVYGSQIVVTCESFKAAERWTGVLQAFAKVRGTARSWDEAKENKNTALRPSKVDVYRVFASI